MEKLETINITEKAKRIVKYGLVVLIALSTAAGSAAFNYQHRNDVMKLSNAKVTGTMIPAHVLIKGKVKELLKEDGEEVHAGEVIARMEVEVTEAQIKQLEDAFELAKKNYAQLQVGQMVKVPVRKPVPRTVTQVRPSYQPSTRSRSRSSSANIAALEERKNRMELLFEMGAVSRKQLEEARKEYELARAAGYSSSNNDSYSSSTTTESVEIEYVTEYVDQLQPTPPDVLNAAQLAAKKAELALNVAKQESQQTEITAPIDGVVYYNVSIDDEVEAGDIIARVVDNNELWIEAEVTESQFDKLSLGMFVNYSISGHSLSGTIIEKAASTEYEDQIDLDMELQKRFETLNPNSGSSETGESSQPAGNSTNTSMINQYNGIGGPESEAKSNDTSKDESSETTSSTSKEKAADIDNNTTTNATSEADTQVEINDITESKDKYIIRISLPAERSFVCKPNMTTTLTIRI